MTKMFWADAFWGKTMSAWKKMWKSVLDWLLGWLCENALSIQNDNTSGFLLSMK